MADEGGCPTGAPGRKRSERLERRENHRPHVGRQRQSPKFVEGFGTLRIIVKHEHDLIVHVDLREAFGKFQKIACARERMALADIDEPKEVRDFRAQEGKRVLQDVRIGTAFGPPIDASSLLPSSNAARPSRIAAARCWSLERGSMSNAIRSAASIGPSAATRMSIG